MADEKPASLLDPVEQRRQVRVHYYVKIAVSTFLCALLLVVGVPVFMESRVTGSLAYTALGVVLVGGRHLAVPPAVQQGRHLQMTLECRHS